MSGDPLSHTPLSDIDTAIAAAWPARWAKAHDGRPGASKRRTKLRAQFRAMEAFEAFKARNPTASCASCRSFRPIPHSDGMHCEAESDFYGYQTTTADRVCTKWTPDRPAPCRTCKGEGIIRSQSRLLAQTAQCGRCDGSGEEPTTEGRE